MTIREHEPLAPCTTFGVGGAARYFVEAQTVDEVQEALAFARERGLKLFVLGGGSNIVVADSGFDGLVLLMRITDIETTAPRERTNVTVGAGLAWDAFVVWAIEQGFAGLECLSGIPGTVGGAVVGNAGAYGAQVSDTFIYTTVLDTLDGEMKEIKRDDCTFGYHDSMFTHVDGRYIVLSATFGLTRDPAAQPSYRDNRFDMKKLAENLRRAPTTMEVREAVLDMREQKGSLIMSDRVSYKCAGSFFHMPFVSSDKLAEVTEMVRSLDAAKEEHLRPWWWLQGDGSYKVAPGFLLEYTPFVRGYVQNGAGVSPRHTLSIINADNARAADIAALARDMQRAVAERFGIELEREVEYVGDVEHANS